MSAKPARKLSVKRVLVTIAIVMVVVVVALLLVFVSTSREQNAELRAVTEALQNDVEQVDWTDGAALSAGLDSLDALRVQVEKLEEWKDLGPPVAMRWGFYSGDDLLETAGVAYRSAVLAAIIVPAAEHLQQSLRKRRGLKYVQTFEALKAYLLLGEPARVMENRDFFVQRLIDAALAQRGQLTIEESLSLRSKMGFHTLYFTDLWSRGMADALELDMGLVQSVRSDLTRVNSSTRYYDAMVTVLEDEKIDPVGPSTRANLAYPPVSLDEILAHTPAAREVLSSKHQAEHNVPRVVRGPYTGAGRQRVQKNLEDGRKRLVREQWVVPLSAEEVRGEAKILQALERVQQDYEAQYIREWQTLFTDIVVKVPGNASERAQLFEVLVTPKTPYALLLAELREAVQPAGRDAATDPIVSKLGWVVDFAGAEGKDGDAPLAKYIAALRTAAAALKAGEAVDLAALERVSHEQLLTLTESGKEMMTHLMLDPLKDGPRKPGF